MTNEREPRWGRWVILAIGVIGIAACILLAGHTNPGG